MSAVLPIPPSGSPVFDRTGTMTEPWRRYWLSVENAVTTNLAPIDAQYWVSTANAQLTNERNIGALATGYLTITTAAGIATPSTVTGIPSGDVVLSPSTPKAVLYDGGGTIAEDADLEWDDVTKQLAISGYPLSSPYANTFAAGTSAGLNGSTGAVYIGELAGDGAFSSDGLVGIGSQAAQDAHDSAGLFAMGQSAGNGADTSPAAVMVGFFAGVSAAHSGDAVFIGDSSGGPSAGNTVAVGAFAGNGSTIANATLLGPFAGAQVFTAPNLIAIGNSAALSADKMANGIAIGLHAGDSDAVDDTGADDFSILLGNYTGTGGFKNAIAIGQGVANDAEQQFNIGGVLYGLGILTGTTPTATPSSTGRVGIRNSNPGALLDVGLAGSYLGTMRLEGNTSGYVQIQPAAAAGSWTWTLPATDGGAGEFLKTDGSGITSWSAVAAAGLTVGSSPIASGTTTRILYDNLGILGEYTISGTGTVVAMQDSPALITPALGTPTAGVLTSCTGLPIGSGVSGLGTGIATFLGTPSSANLAAALTDETGSGAAVFATSPSLVTPILGTPTSGTLTNCTLPVGGLTGLGSGVATFLGTPSSANLASAVTDETGSGALVFATSPALVTPLLGTPTSGTLTNCTLPVGGVTGLGTNVATFLATPTSANLAAALTDETGTGANVFGTSPSITTANLIGTSTNNDAAAGSVGELLTQSRLRSAATGLTTNTPANVLATALTLTAGDWDLTAMVGYLTGTGTTLNNLIAAVSLTSATLPATDTSAVPTAGEVRVTGPFAPVSAVAQVNGTPLTLCIPQYRVSISGSTTFYLIAQSGFGISTLSAFGSITARRVR